MAPFERRYRRLHSPSLGREMEMLVFGHGGARLMAFPTSMGRFFDWEDRGLVSALGDHLDQGWLQLFCVDSVDSESWYAKALPPPARARRHVQYERYLVTEVIPFTLEANPNPYLIVAGASFGGYHAVNFAFRHPDLVGRVIGMSGLYDISRWADGYSDDDIYFNNPCQFIPNEHEPARLAALRRLDIILAIGRDDGSRLNNEALSRMLWDKGIWNALRIWDGWAHDWPCWHQMLRLYVGGAR